MFDKCILYYCYHLPVIFPRIHLCVLYSVLLSKEHEGVHWPFAFCGCGSTSPWRVATLWFATRGVMWRARTLQLVTVRTHSTPAWLGGSPLACHTAQYIHSRWVQRGEVITVRRSITSGLKSIYTERLLTFNQRTFTSNDSVYLLKVSKTVESSQLMASRCPGGRHKSPICIS